MQDSNNSIPPCRLSAVSAMAGLLMLPALLASTALMAQPPAPPPCSDSEEVICGQNAPEDLVAVGSNWVAASVYGGSGGLALINTSTRSTHIVYPAASARDRHDTNSYPACPAPPAPGFQTHGLYVEAGSGPVYKLFAVAHGPRESIEVFEIDTSTSVPTATWLGCAVAPDPIGLNSVRGLRDGGFLTTNFQDRGEAPAAMRELMGGKVNGQIWEWHTSSGWNIVPGSEASGPNGIELSDDGKTLYVAAWGSQSFFTLELGVSNPVKKEIPLGFRIDNIHWGSDRTLWGAGQGSQGWEIVSIDPDTLQVRKIASVPNTPGFAAGTVVVEVGKSLWAGSFRGDRIQVLPLP